MKRAVLYLRVSTIDQTTANQERELREVAGRMGCEIVKVYRDHGISGAKGRDKRPAFNALIRDANPSARSVNTSSPRGVNRTSPSTDPDSAFGGKADIEFMNLVLGRSG